MRAAFGRIGWMVRKELRQVFRDPRMARLVIVAFVPITPMRPLRVAATARRTAGRITSTTGIG